MSYKVIFDEVRSSLKEGVRYARVRAIANGTDSYKSIFSSNARASLIEQIKTNGVKTNALHRNTIMSNVEKFLKSKLSTAIGDDKDDIEYILGSLPAANYPIGDVEDAFFVDDNTVEAVIRENVALKKLGKEEAMYVDGVWDMIMGGTLNGVSLVFNDLKTTRSGDKLIIDDLQVQGLDFVDRPAHNNTRVIDTFMRAMQDSTVIEEEKMTNEETKPTEPVAPKEQPSVVDVDKIIEEVSAKIEAKEEQKKQEANQSEAEKELAELRKFKDEAEQQKKQLEEEKAEASRIAEEALKVAEEASSKIDNPFAQRAKEQAEQSSPLDGKSLRELIQLKYANQ